MNAAKRSTATTDIVALRLNKKAAWSRFFVGLT